MEGNIRQHPAPPEACLGVSQPLTSPISFLLLLLTFPVLSTQVRSSKMPWEQILLSSPRRLFSACEERLRAGKEEYKNEAKPHSCHSTSLHLGGRYGAGENKSRYEWPSPPYKPPSSKSEHGDTHGRIYESMNPKELLEFLYLVQELLHQQGSTSTLTTPVNLNGEFALLFPSASFQTSISIDLTLISPS